MLDPDENLNKKVEMYSGLAKEDPNIDVGALMLNALQNENRNRVSVSAKRWAYLISISAPPLGLLWAAKYYYSDDSDDAKQVAWVCIILTFFSILIYYIGYKLFFSTAGVSPQQIEQIKPSDIQQLYQ